MNPTWIILAAGGGAIAVVAIVVLISSRLDKPKKPGQGDAASRHRKPPQ